MVESSTSLMVSVMRAAQMAPTTLSSPRTRAMAASTASDVMSGRAASWIATSGYSKPARHGGKARAHRVLARGAGVRDLHLAGEAHAAEHLAAHLLLALGRAHDHDAADGGRAVEREYRPACDGKPAEIDVLLALGVAEAHPDAAGNDDGAGVGNARRVAERLRTRERLWLGPAHARLPHMR